MIGSGEKTAWDNIKDFFITQVVPPIDELQRLIPDSLLFGSIVLFLITSNLSFGVFSFFLVESSIAHKLIGFVFNKAVGESKPSTTPDKLLKCHPGFHSHRFQFERIFTMHSYPSFAVFSLISIATYIGAAMTSFRETLKTMGSDWEVRYNIAIGFIMAVVALFVLWRYKRSCESGGEIGVAAIFGAVVGLGLFFLNKLLFGADGMNFLGLPNLVEKQDTGEAIYVCTPSAAASSQ